MREIATRLAALEYVMLQTLATSYEAMGLTPEEVAEIRETMLKRAKSAPGMTEARHATIQAIERILRTAGEMHRMMSDAQKD